jgi:hypothetical protein
MKKFVTLALAGAAAGALALMNSSHVAAQAPAPAAPPAAGRGAGGGGAGADPSAQLSMPVATVFTSKIGFFTMDQQRGVQYPRVIQVKYGADKGTLLATFAGGNGNRGLAIWRSTDNGETWSHFSDVAQVRGQPCLYELPQKMGEFAAGTLMACGNGISSNDPARRPLDVAYSTDGGKTWAYLSTIAYGGGGRYDPSDRAGLSRDQNPIFEPYLFTDSRGRLVAYFSDERDKKSGYSQLLDHVVSNDGGRTWGPLVYDVAIPDGLSRPGMPIVARDGKGKFYMSYELVSAPGYALEPRTNSAHFKTSTDGDNWGDFKLPGTLIQDRWRQFPNGTPYIVWSPWGGANGSLLVSSRSIVRDNLGRVGQGMFINRNGGDGLWTLLETPIDYNIDEDGYSQTMIPLGDGQEILQIVTVNGRVEYAKFKLPDKLPTYGFPFDSGPDTGPR